MSSASRSETLRLVPPKDSVALLGLRLWAEERGFNLVEVPLGELFPRPCRNERHTIAGPDDLTTDQRCRKCKNERANDLNRARRGTS